MRTISLRRRVILLGVGVLAVVLVVTGVATDVIFGALSRAELSARLTARAAAAEQLAARGVPPRQLIRKLSGGAVHAELVTPDGLVYGDAERAGPDVRVVHRALPDAGQLTLSISLDTVTAPQRRLRQILTEVGLGGLALAALALLATTRVALAPLDAMTSLARSIARGERGQRLAPSRTDTELGRTAAAFDEMLDALEGAERHARDEERRAQMARRDALAAAERTRQFVDDAAHELRTPIAGILAAADAAARPTLDSEQRAELHMLLVREARRAGRLVEDLLSLARLDSGVPLRTEPVELRALAEQQVQRAALLAPEPRVTVTGGPALVTGDAEWLAALLANLLDNARRHTPVPGTIEVSVDGDADESSTVMLTVTDSGPGIPEDDRERIFERLVRLDPARTSGGAGLGLAIARGIARAHHGELRCVGPPPGHGVGAIFQLTLPAAGKVESAPDRANGTVTPTRCPNVPFVPQEGASNGQR